MGNIKDRTGEIRYNNFGSKMEIIKYNMNNDIDVYFEEYDWIYYHASYGNFKKGSIECPYEKRFNKKGYYGEGKYKIKNNEGYTDYGVRWNSILKRCYSESYHNRFPTYIDDSICEEWYNFQNFAKWYEENYYEIKGEKMCLDKDILVKGNKIYSPQTCIFVPQRINILFTKRQNNRGDLPIGVTYHKRIKKFQSQCSNGKNNRICLGYYNTPEEAFQVYKSYKENLIKQVADEYYFKGLIPKKLYDAMYRYEIEITD